MRNKKAAFEMSITTVVVLVIALTLLILGLVFVRQIFSTATKSVETIDEQTQNELINLFGSEGKDIIIKLGSQQTAKVRQGTEGFGFVFGISPTGANINLRNCKYTISKISGTCSNPDPLTWFVYGTNNLFFDKISGNNAFALVKLNIPDTQQPCDHKFRIDANCGSWSASDFFSIQVIKKGFF